MSDEKALGLDEAYSVKTPEDNRRLYAKWAATYESSFVDAKQYRYPKAISEVFNERVPTDADEVARVVDIGCGTGLTGMYLSHLRPHLFIDGLDISPEMLAEARRKQRTDESLVYTNLNECDLTQSIPNRFEPYDALICSGTFTHGHLGPDALKNVLSLVRPAGWIVIGVNNEHFVGKGFETELGLLADAKRITQPEIMRIDVYEKGSPHFGDQARVILAQMI
jgi:predicted TPR repeat methyltransferase